MDKNKLVAEKKAKQTPLKPFISLSNALTMAGHGLTLGEKRLVAIAISGLDSKRPVQSGHKYVSRISSMNYAATFGIKEVTAYEQLNDAAIKLLGRFITFYEPAYERNGDALEPTKHQMHWVGEAKYHKGEGWVELHWWPALMPHLVGIEGKFTSYQLDQARTLKSIYSWRLLEILMRFKNSKNRGEGWAEYTIEDFCASMDATESMRLDFGKIRTQIIERAVAELTLKDHWEIKWQPLRKGSRKVTGLRFEFKRHPAKGDNL